MLQNQPKSLFWIYGFSLVYNKHPEKYIIYNVSGEQVQICRWEAGNVYESFGMRGDIRAPNGMVVENTSVYSEIICSVQGIFDMEVTARKCKLVDIVAEGNSL